MLKNQCFYVGMLVCLLTACGGGGGGSSDSNSLTNVTQIASSSISFSSSSAESSLNASSSIANSSISSSIQSSVSRSSRSLPNIAKVFQVGSSTLVEPVIQITPAPERVQTGEVFTLQTVAFSEEGEIKNINWTQVSGPTVSSAESANQLKVSAGDPGDVVLEGKVTDNKGKSVSKQVAFTVAQPFSSKAKLLQGNSNGRGVDLVIVGDAFLAEDQAKLEEAARDLLGYIFDYDDYALMHYQSLINVWLVESISSSRDVPQSNSGGNTLLGAYFGCAGIARLLCVNDQKVIDHIAQHVPQYDQILVLVNSGIYGGAGGHVATASLNSEVKNVVLHELGHSLVLLADEYVDSNVGIYFNEEPFAANITINPAVLDVKWNYWFEDKNSIAGYNKSNYSDSEVGYFLGGGYRATGIWRATNDSIMRSLNAPYGSVNREAWALTIWNYYSATDKFLPSGATVSRSSNSQVFSVPLIIDPAYMRVNWWVNDVKVEAANSAPFLILTAVDETIRSVKVTVEDDTQFIRRDLKGVSKFQHSWSIQ
ncbi:M64 family metallopeptidase [Cellvibrio sp.]|uniref:M64 family metallopeptidase n=1 Tax=Cellvibrio sp. TaxID=1965322 RepID=UPI00396482C5